MKYHALVLCRMREGDHSSIALSIWCTTTRAFGRSCVFPETLCTLSDSSVFRYCVVCKIKHSRCTFLYVDYSPMTKKVGLKSDRRVYFLGSKEYFLHVLVETRAISGGATKQCLPLCAFLVSITRRKRSLPNNSKH